MASRKRSISHEADVCAAVHKEWDEASCPICMDHPHNAVLLLCTSHEKGCRSYICDTSYRHSNCLDRLKKLREDNQHSPPLPVSPRSRQSTYVRNLGSRATPDAIEAQGNNNLNESESLESLGLAGGLGETSIQNTDGHLEVFLETGDSESLWERADLEENNVDYSPESKLNLKCPLCRGNVLGYKVVEEARKYLNLKARSCSRESCSFLGNYRELRRHARSIHPTVRPGDIDPSRQRSWQRLQQQREYADIVSAIRAAMPGALVFGDYVIENGDRAPPLGERERDSAEVNGPLWTTFFLFQMIGSMDPDNEPRSRSRVRAGHRRSTGAFSRRRFLWGENLLGLQDDNDHEDEDEDNSFMNLLNDAVADDGSPIPRRRRRLTRSRSDEDRS